MRILSSMLAFLTLAALAPAARLAGDEFKLEEGFTLLFNGKNLDGWRQRGDKETLEGKTEAYKGRFKVTDGVIAFDPKPGGDRYIETVKQFEKDVHIKFDFKPGANCNNDFLFRGTKFDIIPLKVKGIKADGWQTFELIATGDKIEHKINGETARKSNAKAKSSTFTMRAEIGAIEVKNIRVKEGS